jgi:peptidoglycan-associated lipoprotein
MRKRSFSRLALLGLLTMALTGVGCHPRPVTPQTPTTAPSTPPSAPAARPTVTLEASSTFIQKGESVTLTWTSTNATSLALTPAVGTVAAQGNTRVSPAESTTYTITAQGPGGQATQSVRVSVGAAEIPQPAPTTGGPVDFTTGVHDAYFDYNKSDLRPDARDALSQTAQYLRQHPDIKAIIEGHCDERGSTEYNLGLGQKRADSVKAFLVSLGIAADRLSTTSYGKEKPFCTAHDETCWQQNRRGHFVRAQ